LNELILEKESATSCINQSFAGPGTCELESEGIMIEFEAGHIESKLLLTRLLAYDIVWNIKASIIFVIRERKNSAFVARLSKEILDLLDEFVVNSN
jgi:hypothetical protein